MNRVLPALPRTALPIFVLAVLGAAPPGTRPECAAAQEQESPRQKIRSAIRSPIEAYSGSEKEVEFRKALEFAEEGSGFPASAREGLRRLKGK